MENILRLLFEIFLIPQAMIEKIFLPGNGMMPVQPTLPIADDASERKCLRKAEEKMNMVWH